MVIADIGLFFGRFHPIVVHFPITLLIAAVIIKALASIPRFRSLTSVVPWLLLSGIITGAVALQLGWLIANDRGYNDSTLFSHRWLAVCSVLAATALWVDIKKMINLPHKLKIVLYGLLLGLIAITGHLGGELTHGESYLTEYAPRFLKQWSDSNQEDKVRLNPNPDSVVVLTHLITPILKANCLPCHNTTQKKGGLELMTSNGLMASGDNGPVVIAGKAEESELFKRITLPPTHTKFMPLKKMPLSYNQVVLIKWWIDNGAQLNASISEMTLNDEIEYILDKDYKFQVIRKPYFEVVEATPADSAKVAQLQKEGFVIMPLAQNNNFLSLAVSPDITSVSIDQLKAVLSLKDQITWIDLSDKNINDEHMEVIAQFPHLTKLKIQNNPITDKGVEFMANLEHLEVINLYGTDITDRSLALLSDIKSMRVLYIWRTLATQEAISQTRELNTKLQIVN